MDSQSGQNCNSPPLASTTGATGCGCPSDITLHILPTTGGNWYIRVDPQISIDNLKKLVSKRLKVHKERICLLYRDRQLQDGNLLENGLADGSRLTLLPSVETGLLTQRPELSVMQALESLNDNQVNDFLSGKAPLNLTMRLGDHMMLIQLQLSTVTAGAGTPSPGDSGCSAGSTRPPSPTPSSSRSRSTRSNLRESNRQILLSNLADALSKVAPRSSPLPPNDCSPGDTPPTSPIQSLSDLAFRTTVPVPTAARIPQSRPLPPTSTTMSDPIAAGLTSCLCPNILPSCNCNLGKNINPVSPQSENPSPTFDDSNQMNILDDCSQTVPVLDFEGINPLTTRLDTRALAQASRNLTQTLRQLSSEVLTSREIEQRAQGAIIESMQHHGRGVYSGTFSGTLNPALQDSRGLPRRDISTIVHILNDLLCASPPVKRNPSSTPPMTPSPTHLKVCECHRCRGRCGTPLAMSHHETHDEQNTRTRDKIEQLRLVMGERRERRRLRKQKIQPYTIQAVADPTPNTDAVSA